MYYQRSVAGVGGLFDFLGEDLGNFVGEVTLAGAKVGIGLGLTSLFGQSSKSSPSPVAATASLLNAPSPSQTQPQPQQPTAKTYTEADLATFGQQVIQIQQAKDAQLVSQSQPQSQPQSSNIWLWAGVAGLGLLLFMKR